MPPTAHILYCEKNNAWRYMLVKKAELKIIENAPVNTHFAAVNSGNGFLCFYSDVFGNGKIKRRYIIKGGPGTGKSSFMKRAAEYAAKKGRDIEYFRCSSDPVSLDGIIVDGEIAILDGTAPHIYDPVIAGAADEIVNLGEFWDADRLYTHYNDIAALSALRSNAYSKVYKFLSAAMNVSEANDCVMGDALLEDKMRAAAWRIMRQIPDGKEFSLKYGFVNAIGMSGRVHLDTYEKKAKKLYAVYDSYGLGWRFLSTLLSIARKKELRTQVSYMPLDISKPDAVYFPDSGIAFVLYEDEDREGSVKINMKRFTDSKIVDARKAEYRLNHRLYEALLLSATEALSEAGRYHFKLEDIYVECMDFEAEAKFIAEFCEKLFGE